MKERLQDAHDLHGKEIEVSYIFVLLVGDIRPLSRTIMYVSKAVPLRGTGPPQTWRPLVKFFDLTAEGSFLGKKHIFYLVKIFDLTYNQTLSV